MKISALLLLLLSACLPISGRVLTLPPGCHSWNQLPLRVSIASNAMDYWDAVQDGMNEWNKKVGTKVFVLDNHNPQVIVVEGATRNELEEGYADINCVAGEVASVITMKVGMDDFESPTFATHELGHALGLGHSTNEQSVMQGLVYKELMGENNGGRWDDDDHMYRITETDAKIVRLLHHAQQATSVLPQPHEGAVVPPIPSVAWMEPGVCRPPLGSDDEHVISDPAKLAHYHFRVYNMLNHVTRDQRTEHLVRVRKSVRVTEADLPTWPVQVTVDVAP